MKKFKEKIKSLPPELFAEMNELLSKHGLMDAEISKIRLKCKNVELMECQDGKELYCWVDSEGKTHCRCI